MVEFLYDFPGIALLSGSSMRILWFPSISMIWMKSRKSNSEVIFWNSWILNISYLAPSQCNSRSLKSNSFQRLGSSMFWEILSVPQVLFIYWAMFENYFFTWTFSVCHFFAPGTFIFSTWSRYHDHLHNQFPNIQTKTNSVH